MRPGANAPSGAKSIGLADAIRCAVDTWLETERVVLVAFWEELVWLIV
jgi:hypothetical protein